MKPKNWINEIKDLDFTKNRYSQYGEEVIIKHILQNIGITKNFFVDVGAGGAGRNLSNTKLLLEQGFKGLSFDTDGSVGTIKEFIKPDNIVNLLSGHGCPYIFSFLSVDIDSFDYDVIENILKNFVPVLVCAEFNGTLNPESCVKLKYEDGYTWDGTNKYGFSFGAGVKLFSKYGYKVIYSHKDTNMFAVHESFLLDHVDFEAPKAKQNIYHPVNPKAVFEEC